MRFVKILLWAILLPLLLVGVYTWASLNWVYSSGERAGYVQKLSEKGYVCKTFEGELVLVSMPGTQAEKFFFTVKKPELAKQINESLGKKVVLTYEEHKGIPSSCFGETSYFVQAIKVMDK
jgi:outer membrane lipoprotein-sorting protein